MKRQLLRIVSPMPKELHEMTVAELQDALLVRTFEVNIIIRALSLLGVQVDADVVERVNKMHPNGYPEIIVGSRNDPG